MRTETQDIKTVPHTPGEWKLHGTIVHNENTHICDCSIGRVNTPYVQIVDEESANARLIAAAPDLLEAAKLFYELCNSANVPGNDDLDQLFTAINKATMP